MSPDVQRLEAAVSAYYQPLYRFALGLSRREADAADLTQRAFERLSEKEGSVRDSGKIKTWLFTTLYRDFLQQQRRKTRFPTVELDGECDPELENKIAELPRPDVAADVNAAVAALHSLDEPFRSVLVLFYLHEHSYREIAGILEIPVGTVMSRLARGKELLKAKFDLQENPAGKRVSKNARV